jgi:hypothetical protein
MKSLCGLEDGTSVFFIAYNRNRVQIQLRRQKERERERGECDTEELLDPAVLTRGFCFFVYSYSHEAYLDYGGVHF